MNERPISANSPPSSVTSRQSRDLTHTAEDGQTVEEATAREAVDSRRTVDQGVPAASVHSPVSTSASKRPRLVSGPQPSPPSSKSGRSAAVSSPDKPPYLERLTAGVASTADSDARIGPRRVELHNHQNGILSSADTLTYFASVIDGIFGPKEIGVRNDRALEILLASVQFQEGAELGHLRAWLQGSTEDDTKSRLEHILSVRSGFPEATLASGAPQVQFGIPEGSAPRCEKIPRK